MIKLIAPKGSLPNGRITRQLKNGGFLELGFFPRSWGLGIQVEMPLEITLSVGPWHLWWMA